MCAFDARAALRETDLFADLEADELDLISKLIKWRNVKKGTEIIYHKGESDDVYFIASGRVTVTNFSETGKEISYQELGPGAMFGELSAIDQLPRTANVISLEAACIGTISRCDYWMLIEQYPSVAAAALRRLASMVRFLVDRVYQYGALDVKDRVRIEVLRLARNNMVNEESATIQEFPTHKEIANRVNTHREAVTRELNKLTRMGLIEQHQRVLTVTSVQQLNDMLPEDL